MKNVLLKKLSAIFSILVALTLVIIKFVAWFFTGSLIILSSMTDSFLDLTTSLINFFAIRYSAMPSDKNHKFGHTAVEDIAGLIQGGFIGFSGAFIIFKGIMSFIEKKQIICDSLCIGIMVASLLLTIALVIFQKYTVKRTKSLVIAADSLQYTTDILMNIVFIISLLLINYNETLYFLDPLMAILVALYILKSSYKIGKTAFDNLMGREVSDELLEQIVEIIKSEKNILGFHDLKTRKMGTKTIIQVHVEIGKKLTFEKAHKISHDLDKKFESEIEDCEITIHQDPV